MLRQTWIHRTVLLTTALASVFASPLALSQDKQIKIAHIYSKTGPLEAMGEFGMTWPG